ncbi:unnamed protein product [Ophioblennius macclurei]
MTCTRVLHALSQPKTAGLSVDLAKGLTQRQPLYQLLAMSPLNATQRSSHFLSSSSSPPHASSQMPSGLRSCLRRCSGGMSKKRVVFADSKGLALTAVRVFIPELSSCSSPLVTRAAKPPPYVSSRLQQQQHRLLLGFPPPTLDLKDFLTRPREMHVQLESCGVSENSFGGKVFASHCGSESAVHVRVTFDSWRSQHDIPCMFLQQQRCGASDVDVFTFDINVPPNIDPKERIEFCVSFRPAVGAMLYWDDNRGQNYRLYVEHETPHVTPGSVNRYYSNLSKYRPPCWPSSFVTKVHQGPASDWLHVQRALTKTSVLTK